MDKLPRSNTPKLSEEQRTEVCTRYKEGEPTTSLSQEFGISIAAICGLLKRRGIPRNHRKAKLHDKALEYRSWWRSNAPVAFGYCWCRCGKKTILAAYSEKSPKRVQGEPVPFILGHAHYKPLDGAYKVENRGHETPCWIWQRATTVHGYGVLTRDGKETLAHRLFYQKEKGAIRKELSLHHLCEQKLCVNPDHVIPVSNAEHGRIHGQSGRVNHSAKLSEENVREIFSLRQTSNLSFKALGGMFGVDAATVEKIVNRKTWKYLKL